LIRKNIIQLLSVVLNSLAAKKGNVRWRENRKSIFSFRLKNDTVIYGFSKRFFVQTGRIVLLMSKGDSRP